MKPFYLLLLAVIFLYSCNAPRYVYSPSLTNTPMFSGEGEGNALATVSSNGLGNGAGVNLAANYSPVKHIGAGVQYYSTSDNNRGYDDGIGGRPPQIELNYKRSMAQAQLFFYTSMGESKKIFAELGLGAGTGKYNINDRQTDTVTGTVKLFFHNAKARHLTINGTIYGIFGKTGASRVALSLRMNNVKFRDVTTSYSNTQLRAYWLDSLAISPSINFLEPALSFNIGFPSLPGFEIIAQTGLSFKMNGPLFKNRNSHFSIGAGYRLGRKRKNIEPAYVAPAGR